MKNKKDSDFESCRAKVLRVGRSIYFFDSVDESSVLEAIRHIHHLELESTKKPITLLINSYGGSCYDGLALYDTIRACPAPVITVAMGMVASMGFIIFLAGDKRFATVNTKFLNHQPSSEIAGKSSDIEVEAHEITKLKDLMIGIVAERTKIPKAQIKKNIKVGDNYYDAKEAMKNGIIHKVIDYTDKSPEKVVAAPVEEQK
jgi:ATP-dependent Clp protease protease subunit